MERDLDAYCEACQDVAAHAIVDAGSCACGVCGAVQALMVPIAASIAASLGVDSKAFLMAVAFGASMSFATPTGYQTNTMVYGPGGYTFRDYLRVGAPLNLVLLAIASVLIPIFWPS